MNRLTFSNFWTRPASFAVSLTRLAILVIGAVSLPASKAVAGNCNTCASNSGPCQSAGSGYAGCLMVGSTCFNSNATCS
jgi:hypothetical protein